MRLGIIGGTFDPVHNAHLFIAEEARHRFDLDRVLFVTSATPPHKPDYEFSPARDRLAMVRIALEGNGAFEASPVEVERGGVSYTVDTLTGLGKKDPDAELFFITGADAVLEIKTWKEPERVLELSKFVVAARAGFDLDELEGALPGSVAGRPAIERVLVMESDLLDISASRIRKRVAAGLPVRYLMPEAVWRYIYDRGLYRKVSGTEPE